ncbi:MAG: CDP-glucose 4,6-dehydratase [Lachnospiraceae bacterium]|nr:CDP-glucose 4,6-dehydratase [Lachnospiraceae bacterium]
MDFREVLEYYKGKKVFITGHTGFKGSWLCQILKNCGALVIGYALEPMTDPSLFVSADIADGIKSYIGDIRDLDALWKVFDSEKPQIVIHMAAQPLVRESYKDPVTTYETNVMGTVNILECVRRSECVESVINVTTDKVYRNNEWDKGYVESDFLDGYDPYSNSKSCSELVTHSYIQSFLADRKIPVSTCRAGNVIGGGDFATDRIIPDCVRACFSSKPIVVRNPNSTRPYQHVLEPLFAYIMVAMKQAEDYKLASNYNIGPDDDNCVTTGELVDIFTESWNDQRKKIGIDILCEAVRKDMSDGGPHEASFLKLDCTKLKQTFGWKPHWNIKETIDRILEFEIKRKLGASADELAVCMNKQIKEYVDI